MYDFFHLINYNLYLIPSLFFANHIYLKMLWNNKYE